jgi:hypothetical protein
MLARLGTEVLAGTLEKFLKTLERGIKVPDGGRFESVRNFVCGHSMRSIYAPQTEKPDA